jgi:hypothetical protein
VSARSFVWPLVGFALGMAVMLPLMLTFDSARPWIALAGLSCAGLMYAWGAHRSRQ